MKIPLSALEEPFYEGSVQRLFAVPEDDSLMVTQTTSRGSVFDVGALFEIEGNDFTDSDVILSLLDKIPDSTDKEYTNDILIIQ